MIPGTTFWKDKWKLNGSYSKIKNYALAKQIKRSQSQFYDRKYSNIKKIKKPLPAQNFWDNSSPAMTQIL